MANKRAALEKALEITKAYAGSSGTAPLPRVLEDLYKKLCELADDADKG